MSFVQISPAKAVWKGIHRAKTPSPTKSTMLYTAHLTPVKRTRSPIEQPETPIKRPHTQQADELMVLQSTKAGTWCSVISQIFVVLPRC